MNGIGVGRIYLEVICKKVYYVMNINESLIICFEKVLCYELINN